MIDWHGSYIEIGLIEPLESDVAKEAAELAELLSAEYAVQDKGQLAGPNHILWLLASGDVWPILSWVVHHLPDIGVGGVILDRLAGRMFPSRHEKELLKRYEAIQSADKRLEEVARTVEKLVVGMSSQSAVFENRRGMLFGLRTGGDKMHRGEAGLPIDRPEDIPAGFAIMALLAPYVAELIADHESKFGPTDSLNGLYEIDSEQRIKATLTDDHRGWSASVTLLPGEEPVIEINCK